MVSKETRSLLTRGLECFSLDGISSANMANVAMVGVLTSASYRQGGQERQQQPFLPQPSTSSTSPQHRQYYPFQQKNPQQQQQQQQQQHEAPTVRILPPPSYRHRQTSPDPPFQEQTQRQDTMISLTTSSRQNILSVPQTARTVTTLASSTPANPAVAPVEDSSSRQCLDLSYMHRPPTILPNYGKRSRGSVLPKSNVSRVLLYDNLTQQTMLDVRMNSIRSQSYKTNRELDMHMKSFMSRRKVREKALKKITRVEHKDDYEGFTKELEQHYSSNFQGINAHKSPNKKTKGVANAKFTPNLFLRDVDFKQGQGNPWILNSTAAAGDTLPRICVSSQSDDTAHTAGTFHSKSKQETDDNTSLPVIVIPSVRGNNNGNDSDDAEEHVENDVKSRDVALHFVEDNLGVTRVFNVVIEQPENTQTAEKSLRDETSFVNKPTVSFNDTPEIKEMSDENNNTSSTPDNYKSNKQLAPHLKPRKSIFQIQKERKLEEELQRFSEREKSRSSLSDIPLDLHPEQPTIDSRYLHLRRLLVPQDPPNEGFAELSPSFPKEYPSLKNLSPRSRGKEIARRKGKRERNGSSVCESDGEDSKCDLDFIADYSENEN